MSRRGWLLVAMIVVIAVGGIAIVAKLTQTTSSTPSRDLVLDLSARVSERHPGGDPSWVAEVPQVQLARTLRQTNVYRSAAGKALVDNQGTAIVAEGGADIAIVDAPEVVNGESWFRVYVLLSVNSGPTEFFGWLPEHDDSGAKTIAILGVPACPAAETIVDLARVDPFTRLKCLGAASISLRGSTWDRMLPTWYRIVPDWFGDQQVFDGSTMSIHDRQVQRFPDPREAQRFVDVQLPPDLDRPPLDFQVDMKVHAADELSGDCVRRADATTLVPPDDPIDSHLWCATRLVVERWTPLLGPEGRSIDPSAPQLHRHPDRGANNACAGVGMAPLTFRMDPTRLDPVWLEAEGAGGFQIIPDFDPGFHPVFAPDLVIVDERGQLVARNGTPVDPDGSLAGHFICPTGQVVYFD